SLRRCSRQLSSSATASAGSGCAVLLRHVVPSLHVTSMPVVRANGLVMVVSPCVLVLRSERRRGRRMSRDKSPRTAKPFEGNPRGGLTSSPANSAQWASRRDHLSGSRKRRPDQPTVPDTRERTALKEADGWP